MSGELKLLKWHLLMITGTEEKGNWIKELKFKNCSEPVKYVGSRTTVQHISIICYYSESVLEIVLNI